MRFFREQKVVREGRLKKQSRVEMGMIVRAGFSLLLCFCLISYGLPASPGQASQSVGQDDAGSDSTLLDHSYVYLFEKASDVRISKIWIDQTRERLEEEKKSEKHELDSTKHEIEHAIDQSQEELKELNQHPEEGLEIEKKRHTIHCRIQKLREKLRDTKLALEKGVDHRYDNKFAKLKVLEEWPAEYSSIQAALDSGESLDRKFSDFRDVGFRGGVFENQQKDIKDGREAVEEMKRLSLMPPEIEDEQVQEYMRKLAGRIARHSDLRVPLHVSVLHSREINAFALPGGYLFVNSGLLLKAEKESELAGVIAHEIAHSAARHANRLMTRANIAGIIFQAAQVAALIFTGGVASIATYYALQYGFYGLGLALSLTLLGVSRDYELEADILGVQYLWNSGYATRGFIDFFDRMAQEEGYVTGLSWFRTHPPFYKRMARSYEEILLLPSLEDPTDDSEQFHQIRQRLKKAVKEMEDGDRQSPTLRRVYDCEGVEIDL